MSNQDRFIGERPQNGADDSAVPFGPTLDERVSILEGRPNAIEIVNVLRQHGAMLEQFEGRFMQLAQQRSFVEMQIERNTRVSALDLAIKASPQGDIARITDFAGAFLHWLRLEPATPEPPAPQTAPESEFDAGPAPTIGSA